MSPSGDSGPSMPSPGPAIRLPVLRAGHWGQRVRLTAAPRGWKLEQPVSIGEDAELRALSSSAPSHLCDLEYPALLSLTFLSWEMGVVTPTVWFLKR